MAGVDLTSPETVARAVLSREHKARGATPLTAEQVAMNARAKEIEQEAKEKGPRTSIESMGVPTMPDDIAVKGFMTEAFYSTKDINGKMKVEKDSLARKTEADKVRAVAEKYIKGEYKDLTDPEKTIARTAAKEVIMDWPEAKAIFDALPAGSRTNEINKTLDEFFSRPEFKPIAKKLFAGVIKPEELHHIKTELIAKQERAKKTREYREQSLKNKNGEYDSYNRIIEGFRDSSKAGTDAEKLENLRKDESKNRSDKQTKETDVRRKEQDIQDTQNQMMMGLITKKDGVTEILKLKGEINTLRGDIGKIDGELNQITALEAKRATAEENIRRIQEEQIKLKEDLDEADYQYHLARAEQEADNVQHIRSEEAVLDKFRGVFREGMRELLTKEIEKAEAAQAKRIEKADEDAKKATTAEEKNILAAVNNRWDRDITNRNFARKWWNPNNKEFNRPQINRDYTRLMSEGADAVVANMMLDNGVAADLLSAQAWLTANKDAADRMKAQVTETLLTRRIQTGNITEGDARFIAGSTWGKEAINKAIQNRDDIKKAVEDLRGRGIIKGSMGEGLYELVRSNPAFWLAIIFGSAALGAIATPVLLGGGMFAAGVGAAAGGSSSLGGLMVGKAEYSR